MKFGIIPLIGIILGVLKVCGLVSLSWWWIALMVFIAPAVIFVVLAVVAIIGGVVAIWK